MTVRCKGPTPPTCAAHELEDGQLAEIIHHPDYWYCAGWVVQRFRQSIVCLGKPYNQGFDLLIDSRNTAVRFRILEPGETVEIQE